MFEYAFADWLKQKSVEPRTHAFTYCDLWILLLAFANLNTNTRFTKMSRWKSGCSDASRNATRIKRRHSMTSMNSCTHLHIFCKFIGAWKIYWIQFTKNYQAYIQVNKIFCPWYEMHVYIQTKIRHWPTKKLSHANVRKMLLSNYKYHILL